MKIYFLIFFSIAGVVKPSYSQSSDAEIFWIHFDRTFYHTGETIWYKVYNTNFDELEDHSKVAYLNIHDKNGSLIQQQKHEIIDGKCAGSFSIPINWGEDYYYITCFSKWNLQFQDGGVYVKKIPIFNSFSSGDTSTQAGDSIINGGQANLFPNNVEIILDKLEYSTRQNVKFRISSDLQGNCSVVVKDLKLNTLIPQEFENNNPDVGYALDTNVKMENGLSVEGIAIDPKTKIPVQSDVIMLYQTGTNKFLRMSSKEGNIDTPINSFLNETLFQIFNMNPFQTEIIEFEVEIFGDTLIGLPDNISKPPRNAELTTYLNYTRLRKNIDEIFSSQKIDSLAPPEFLPILFKADKTYEMNKYKSMKTLEEFLKEIVNYAELQSQNDKTTVRLNNSETRRFFMDKPWYLVDGYITRNEEDVLSIPFKNLVRIEILNTNKSILNQLDPVMIRGGMIVVYTDNYSLRNSIDPTNVVKINGFCQNVIFDGPTSLSIDQARAHPDFSPVLYWNPSVNLTSPKELEFATSDLQGDFLIEIHGYSENGQKLYGSKIFSVKY